MNKFDTQIHCEENAPDIILDLAGLDIHATDWGTEVVDDWQDDDACGAIFRNVAGGPILVDGKRVEDRETFHVYGARR